MQSSKEPSPQPAWGVKLEDIYTQKLEDVKSAPSSVTEPGRLKRQRKIDGSELLSRKLAEFEAGLALAQETGRVLRTQWNAGSLDVTEGEYKQTLESIEQKVIHFLSRVCTLQNHRHQILGKIQDDTHLLRIELQDDWAYIDGLLRAFRNPHNAQRTIKATKPNNTQARFRSAVIKNYEAEEAVNVSESLLWCPISARFHDKRLLRAAHIVKKNVGENAAQALFGETTDPQGHIWSPKNGLLVHHRYEKWWDAGVIAIVPTDDDENEFQVIVLDHSAFDGNSREMREITYGTALDGLHLQFRGDFRPAKRFLYFKLAVTLLHRQRAEVPGSAFDRQKLPEKAKELWLSPGSYLTGSVLIKLARQVGFLAPKEAAEFWGMPRITNLDEDDNVSDVLAMGLHLSLDSDGEGGAETCLRKKVSV